MAVMINAEKEIELLSSARHEYLNDLQLIKGYLFLKKPGKAEEIIGRVTEKLHHQARLARLHIPECAVYLMDYGWSSHEFSLSYEVIGPERDLSFYDEELTTVYQELFAIIEQYASPIADNTVRIVFNTESSLRIQIYFDGVMTDAKAAEEQLNQQEMNHSFQWVEHYLINNESNENVRWIMCLSIK
jgi:stage 0 sporulation protein B (sporulation initiation phosphotransferase)